MEFVEGVSLEKKLASTPQPPSSAAGLAKSLASAMHVAHQSGVVHRDLKPSNVLLTAEGHPKITDFGLAKNLDNDQGQTRTGEILGTPSYMAPEQASGKGREIGPLTDVYALGAVLYEMLTGRPPFKGANVLETLDQVCLQEPIPPSRLQSKTPSELDTICFRCLEKDPGKRYKSAEKLADDLARFQKGEPIQARPIRPWQRTLKWARRRPTSAALWAVSFLTVLLIVGISIALSYSSRLVAAYEEVRFQKNEAERLQGQAQQERIRAEKLQGIAEAQKVEADKQRARAEQQEAIAQRFVYASDMEKAHRAWRENNVPLMRQILEKHKRLLAEDPRRNEMLGFEWDYLCGQTGTEEFSISVPQFSSMAYSPDGRHLAVCLNRKVQIFDAVAGKKKKVGLSTHRTSVAEHSGVRMAGKSQHQGR